MELITHDQKEYIIGEHLKPIGFDFLGLFSIESLKEKFTKISPTPLQNHKD